MLKLRWNKRGNEWVLLDAYDSILATIEHRNNGWYFKGKYFNTLAYAKTNVIFTLTCRGEL